MLNLLFCVSLMLNDPNSARNKLTPEPSTEITSPCGNIDAAVERPGQFRDKNRLYSKRADNCCTSDGLAVDRINESRSDRL